MGKNRKQIAAEVRGKTPAVKAYRAAKARLDAVPVPKDRSETPAYIKANRATDQAYKKLSQLERIFHTP